MSCVQCMYVCVQLCTSIHSSRVCILTTRLNTVRVYASRMPGQAFVLHMVNAVALTVALTDVCMNMCVCVFARVCMCDWMFVTDVCRELMTRHVISSVSGLWDQLVMSQ